MAMKELDIVFKNKKGIKYAAKFSPSRVEGKQVYNFLAKKDGEDEFSHYGYIENVATIEDSYVIDYKALPKDAEIKRFNSVSGTFEEELEAVVDQEL
jgi:hypothetical protein